LSVFADGAVAISGLERILVDSLARSQDTQDPATDNSVGDFIASIRTACSLLLA